MNEISKKIILVGNINVGKTSLVNQFVHQRFSEQYISTIGVRIDKKQLLIKEQTLNMIIWDLAGESSQQNTPQSYFLGTGGVIYVVDISTQATYQNMDNDLTFLKMKLPSVPIIIAANKSDLSGPSDAQTKAHNMPSKPDFITSAKNGSNVDDLFQRLAELMLL